MESAVEGKSRPPNERKVMNNKFDDLAEGLAQSVWRWQAFRKSAICLAGMSLAALPAVAQFSQLGPLVALSQPNPVSGCDDGFRIPGTLTLNDANEPFVA